MNCFIKANKQIFDSVIDWFNQWINMTDEKKAEGKHMLLGAVFVIVAFIGLMISVLGAVRLALYFQIEHAGAATLLSVGGLIGVGFMVYVGTIWELCFEWKNEQTTRSPL